MKRTIYLAFLLPLLVVQPLAVQAAMQWSPGPERHAHSGQAHAGHSRSAAKVFVLDEGDGASLTLLKPDMSSSPQMAEGDGVKLTPTGMNNYHALIASRTTGSLHETAIRYFYMHGKPTGNSPSQLVAKQKSLLDIRPSPLPREHWRYLSGERTGFQIMFRGRPLAGATVMMSTSNGTSAEYTTDAAGFVGFDLPDDFVTVRQGRSGNAPAHFVLTAGYGEGGERFVTTLSAEYFVNPSHWQSLPLGVATAFGGLLLGGLLTLGNLRRKEK